MSMKVVGGSRGLVEQPCVALGKKREDSIPGGRGGYSIIVQSGTVFSASEVLFSQGKRQPDR